MPGMFVIVRLRSSCCSRGSRAWLRVCTLAASADRAAAKLVVVGLHRDQPIGRVAQLRLRRADLLVEQLRLLPRLGQQRLQLLVVAIERRGPLLILLRLLSERRLLLRRKRDRRLLAVRARTHTGPQPGSA